MLSSDEIARRQAAACSASQEPTLFWWVTCMTDCPGWTGGECQCGEVVWFSGYRQLIGVTQDMGVVGFTLN